MSSWTGTLNAHVVYIAKINKQHKAIYVNITGVRELIRKVLLDEEEGHLNWYACACICVSMCIWTRTKQSNIS